MADYEAKITQTGAPSPLITIERGEVHMGSRDNEPARNEDNYAEYLGVAFCEHTKETFPEWLRSLAGAAS